MVFSVAPNRRSMGSFTARKNTVTITDRVTNRAVELPRMALAWSSLPSPMRTTAREPPPMPTRAEMAETNMITGKHTPSPVRARSPTPSMWPMYMRSTMLYRALTSWAVTDGRASRSSSFPTGSRPRSFSRFAKSLALFLQEIGGLHVRHAEGEGQGVLLEGLAHHALVLYVYLFHVPADGHSLLPGEAHKAREDVHALLPVAVGQRV